MHLLNYMRFNLFVSSMPLALLSQLEVNHLKSEHVYKKTALNVMNFTLLIPSHGRHCTLLCNIGLVFG